MVRAASVFFEPVYAFKSWFVYYSVCFLFIQNGAGKAWPHFKWTTRANEDIEAGFCLNREVYQAK